MPHKKYEPVRFTSPEYLAVWGDGQSAHSYRISEIAMQMMQTMACQGYPDEVCGLLLGQYDDHVWVISEVRQVQNLNSERASDRFQLDPQGYQAIDRDIRGSGLEIIGVFHSHPDCPAKPSPTDLTSAWEGFLYPIVSVCEGALMDVQCWELDDAAGKFYRVEGVTV